MENTNSNPTSQITLQPWANEVARLICNGYSPAQVSVQTAIPLPELVELLKNPEFKSLTKMTSQSILDSTIAIRLRLEMVANSALDTIIDLMTGSRSDIVKRLCANDILDRAGHSVVQKHESTYTVVIDDQKANLILQASNEIQVPIEVQKEELCKI